MGKCRLGAWESSTIGSQLLDGDCSHGWQILTTQLWASTQEKEIGTHHTE